MKKVLLVGFLALILMSSLAMAQTKSLMIPHSQFKPGDSIADYNLNASYCYIRPGSLYGSFMAPVILPEDAKVVKMVAYFKDQGTGNIHINLQDHNL